MTDCTTLLSPLDAGRLQLPNRIVFPAHQTLYSEGGEIGPRMRGYYGARARGGAGAIVVEGAGVHSTTRKFPRYLLAHDDVIVPGLRELAGLVHGYGTKVLLQILHSGSRMPSLDSNEALWAPSDVRSAISPEVPHWMTVAEIEEVQDGFAAAARNVRRAGADGVEIHSAHEYLAGQFLSPHNNRRDDGYGGSLANRARFLLEVIDRVRDAIGEELVVGVRLNGSDLSDDGLQTPDYVEVAKLIDATGKVDYISVTAGTSRTNHMIVAPMDVAQGVYLDYAAAIRAAVSIPVFAVGRVKTPAMAEQALVDGKADAIAMARALIADPDLPRKLAGLDDAGVRPCIGCNECFGRLYRTRAITCLVNPVAGRETELGDPLPALTRRRIAVVGGGPAGMEAARVAAERGHEVVLFEASDELGGLMRVGARPEARRELGDVLPWLEAELERLKVDVRLGARVSATDLSAVGADAVVVATGSVPRGLPVPVTGTVVSAVEAATAPERWAGKPVVVADDSGHFLSYVPAELLVAAGAQVTVVTTRLAPGAGLDEASLVTMLQRLRRAGVRFATSTALVRVDEGSVVLRDVMTGEERVEPAAAAVSGYAGQADDGLVGELRAMGVDVHAVGDCVAPRTALEAFREGNVVGRAL